MNDFKLALQQDLLERYKFSITKLAYKWLLPADKNKNSLTQNEVKKVQKLTDEFAKTY